MDSLNDMHVISYLFYVTRRPLAYQNVIVQNNYCYHICYVMITNKYTARLKITLEKMYVVKKQRKLEKKKIVLFANYYYYYVANVVVRAHYQRNIYII